MADRYGPYRNYRFLLEFDSVGVAAFSECALPDSTTEPIEYRDGNDVKATVRKLGSLTKYGNLTLKRGTTDSIELVEWRKQVEQGDVDGARQSIAVVLLDEEGNPGPRWEFENAWPSKYDAPDLNATANEVAIETLEIVVEGMERVS
ncbi:phage tail protein [Halobium palmae]|uniref:Phage tail protein n=1 Tax=Halobium palmae TaxID=1776492 RepID=A0ABD5RYZ2_9EURY